MVSVLDSSLEVRCIEHILLICEDLGEFLFVYVYTHTCKQNKTHARAHIHKKSHALTHAITHTHMHLADYRYFQPLQDIQMLEAIPFEFPRGARRQNEWEDSWELIGLQTICVHG